MTPQQLEEAPFSLAASILLPFQGFNSSPSSFLDQTDKLQAIISNVTYQQEQARANMMFLVQQRAETLVATAKKELADLGEESEETEKERVEREQERRSVAEMLEGMRKPARKDARPEDYASKPSGASYTNTPAPAPSRSADGDVEMGGTEINARPRTSRAIRKELSRALKEVVDRAVGEMEAYDRHCEEVTNVYRQALNRRMSRDGGLPLFTGGASMGGNGTPGLGGVSGGILRNGSVNTGGVGGILKNRNEQSPINHSEIRRMSTGMPVVGFSPTVTKAEGQPARQYENIEMLARRGSK